MANLSERTRKEQVLDALRAANGRWVDGPDLANEQVGGSEGLKRLRELREEGFAIENRMHPDPDRDIWQYRLVEHGSVLDLAIDDEDVFDLFDDARPNYPSTKDVEEERIEREVEQALLSEQPVPERESPWPADHEQQTPIRQAVRRKEDGTFEYVPPQRTLTQETAELPKQLEVDPTPAEVPQGPAFTSRPSLGGLGFGAVLVCPRCRAKTTRGRTPKEQSDEDLAVKEKRKKAGPKLVDPDGFLLYRDPTSKEVRPCMRCNGYGMVPNQGPIA